MEDPVHSLQFELSLKRLAMTAVIGSIYEDLRIKEKMKEIIRTQNFYQEKSSPLKLLNKLAFNKLDDFNLPKDIVTEARGIIPIFTKKIIIWANYVRYWQFDFSYLDETQWTSIGTVDEAKIFEEYWLKHGDFSKIIKKDLEADPTKTLEMACIYMNEKVIIAHQNVLFEACCEDLTPASLSNIENKADKVAAVYICYFFGCEHEIMKEKNVMERLKKRGEVDADKMIFVCVKEGLAKAAKFFWNYLNNNEKERNIINLAFDSLQNPVESVYEQYFDDYFDEVEATRGAEIVHFLINKMSLQQRNEFVKKNISGIVQLFLIVWPYQEILLKILDEECISQINWNDSYEDILYDTLCRMIKDSLYKSSRLYQNVFHKLLRKIMNIVPKSIKEQTFFHHIQFFYENEEEISAVKVFFDRFDLIALKIIVNDKDLIEERDMMLDMGDDKIWELRKSHKLELIVNFMDSVLVTNEERKNFITRYDLADQIFKSSNRNLKIKVFNWVID